MKRRAWPLFALSLAALVPLPVAALAQAVPTGGAVTAGQAAISAGVNAVTVDQSSTRAVIDWNSFSIGAGASVQFNNGAGVTLNRVTGGAGSQIDGRLSATGGVYLLNPAGVLVGPGGVVSVGGGFVASTLDVSDAQFMAGGSLTFRGASAASVENQGAIGAANGDVVMIAATVANRGRIDAPKGTAGLAAGYEVVLLDPAQDTGRLSITLGGADTSATNAGVIAAANAELRANGGNVYALALNDSHLEVTGVTEHDGRVFLIADGGSVTARGEIVATKADGTGGFVETSGATVDFDGLSVKAGDWLIDPVTLTVDASAATTIANNLLTTNVTLKTTASSASGPGLQLAGAGDINIIAPINELSGTTNTLTLDAYHGINVTAPITIDSGRLVLTTNDGGTGGDYLFGPAANVTFNGGPGSGAALTINGQDYTLIYTRDDLLAINADLTGHYALAGLLEFSGAFGGTPIAGSVDRTFTGEFTGLGNTIRDFRILAAPPHDAVYANGYATTGQVGLFGNVGVGGMVRDVHLQDATVAGGDGAQVGALVGALAGTVKNVTVSGDVIGGSSTTTADGTAFADVGGLVGSSSGLILNANSSAFVIAGNAFAGGVVGASVVGGTVQNSFSTGGVIVSDNLGGGLSTPTAGGLVGIVYGFDFGGVNPLPTLVTGSGSTANVFGGAGSIVGGLAGNITKAQVTDSYALGGVFQSGSNTVTRNFIGGFVGLMTQQASVTGSYATGQVFTAGGQNNTLFTLAGGFVGDIDQGSSVSNAYALGSVISSGSFNNLGGFAGVIVNASSADHVYATGSVANLGGHGGLVGLLGLLPGPDASTLTNSYWDTGTTGQLAGFCCGSGTATNVIGIGGSTGLSPYLPGTYGALDLVNTWIVLPGDTRPMLRSEYRTVIRTPHQLQLMQLDLAANYFLVNDLDMSVTTQQEEVWGPGGFSPVGPTAGGSFTGLFDGRGFTIDGLSITRTTQVPQLDLGGFVTTGSVGLFGQIGATGRVQNLNISNANIIAGDGFEAGILAGAVLGQVFNSSTSGFIIGGSGLSTGLGFATANTGGMVGSLYGSIQGSHSSAIVSGLDANAFAGGLVGATGAVASRPAPSIVNSYATGDVSVGNVIGSRPSDAGGLVGFLSGLEADGLTAIPVNVSRSYATGAVSGGSGSRLGGFAGSIIQANVTTSWATGSVSHLVAPTSLSNDSGGFAGTITAATVTDSWAGGSVFGISSVAAGGFSGGFVGDARSGASISRAYALGSVSMSGSGSPLYAGFAALLESGASADQVYATGSVSGVGPHFGLVAFLQGALSNSYWDEGTTGQTVGFGSAGGTATNVVGIGGATGLDVYATATYSNFNLNTDWFMIAGETRPLLRAEASPLITNTHQLQLMAANLAGTYSLASDINAADVTSAQGIWNPANGFVPVGSSQASPFIGTLNGRGFTISNLTIIDTTAQSQGAPNGTTNGAVGLFGFVGVNGSVRRLNLANAHVTGGDGMLVGAVVGQLRGTVDQVNVSGTVVTGNDVGATIVSAAGGVVGDAGDGAGHGLVNRSVSSATVTGGVAYVGGLVGWAHGGLPIVGSNATGAVTLGSAPVGAVAGLAAGGLVGAAEGATNNPVIIQSSYATGAVTSGGGTLIGGLAGKLTDTQVADSYATGSVTHTSGGQNGLTNQAGGFAGAILGSSTVSRSFASGAVTSISTPGLPAVAGGFAGNIQGAAISNAYASGSVTVSGAGFAGSFAGIAQLGASVDRVIATGAVSAVGTVGGLVGQLGTGSSLTNSYWDVTTTGVAGAIGSNQGTATSLRGIGPATGFDPFDAATYPGLDFQNIWATPAPGDRPGLYGVSHVLRLSVNDASAAYGDVPVFDVTVTGLQFEDTSDVLDNTTAFIAGGGVSSSGYYNVGQYATVITGTTATGASGDYRVIDQNGVFTVTPRAIDVSFNGAVQKTYDRTTAATLTPGLLSFGGVLGADDVSFGGTASASYDNANAGTGKTVTVTGITLSGADAGNYTFNGGLSAPVGVIDPKGLTLTAVSQNKVYDGNTLASSTPSVSGLVAGDTISNLTARYASRNVGTHLISVDGGYVISDGAGGNNYDVTLVDGSGDITAKALTASLTGQVRRVYDGTTDAALANGNFGLSGVVGSDDVSLSHPSSGAFDNKNAGTNKTVSASGLSISGADAGNYTVNANASAPIGIIDPKTLTAGLIGSVEKSYDGNTTATLTPANYNFDGVLGSDNVTLNGPTSGTYDTATAGTGKTVSVSGISLSGADASNYAVNSEASAPIGIIDSSAQAPELQIVLQAPALPPPDVGAPLNPPPDTPTEAAAADAAAAAGDSGAAEAAEDHSGANVFPVARNASNNQAAGDNSPVTGSGNRDLWTTATSDDDDDKDRERAP